MENTLKIKVNIANRTYPLTVKREEEQKIRQAVNHINDAVRRFEERYAVQDKQDVLAMCALQLASQIEKMRGQHAQQVMEYEDFVKDLENMLPETQQQQ